MIVMGVEGPPNGVVGCQREEEEKLGLVSVDSSAASLLSPYQAPPVLFPTSSTLELGSTSPQRSVLLQASPQRPLPLIVPHSRLGAALKPPPSYPGSIRVRQALLLKLRTYSPLSEIG